MKPEAIVAAQAALDRATKALEEIKKFGSEPAQENMQRVLEAWSDLLAYGNRVYGKLERGAKRGPADAWLRKIKEERQSDPLLRYLHQARNVEDHGIVLTARPDVNSEIFEVGNTPETAVIVSMSRGVPRMSGGKKRTRLIGLLPVQMQNGNRELPGKHLSVDIEATSPICFGSLFVRRLGEIVAEAKSFIPTV